MARGSIYGTVETKNKFGRDSSLKNTSFDNLECGIERRGKNGRVRVSVCERENDRVAAGTQVSCKRTG